MEDKHVILIIALVLYAFIVFLFSRLGNNKQIGAKRLFVISFFLTPVLGLAFFLSSSEKKLHTYTEERYKCSRCGYIFSEYYQNCPFCEKDDQIVELIRIKKLMT